VKKASFVKALSSEDLHFYGPLISVTLTAPIQLLSFLEENGLPQFETRSGYALIDTGAQNSVVDAKTLAELDIPAVGTGSFLTTHGIADLPVYNLSATFPDLQTAPLPLEQVAGGLVRNEPLLGKHVIMLLGRDLLEEFVLTYDGPNSTFLLSR
jgi:hypothetical protein